MPLTPGSRLGVFELIDLIGRGGMGEVYRARDTKLDRDVAIKTLPAAFATDAERLARFTREAKTLASLNHPNIGAIYGLEESEGATALVMELVEGPTLAELIEAKPQGPKPKAQGLPLDDVLPIARQIAEALEAAHEQGIIHRDLKPANIKIRDDGAVKVLDFGLAKALDAASGQRLDPRGSMSPTMSLGATQAGVILGTAAYMAPEQAKGREADRRADVWAFGVVLYEMLTGEHLFGGDSVAETLASVMKDPLAFGKLPSGTPGTIRTLVARCLDRDLRRRVQSIGEARIVIEDAIGGVVPEEASGPRVAHASTVGSRAPWAISALLLLALGALAWAWYPRPPAPTTGVAHFTVAPPENTTLSGNAPNASQQAVSPDGRHVAFLADAAGASRSIWVRPLGSLAAQKLDRTDGATFPFWSPDSQFIAFFQDGKLRRIPVSGGSPLTIFDAPNGEGGTWNRDGVIVFAPAATGPLHRVLAAGGVSAPVTELQEGERSHSWPWFLPDGQRFLYLIETSAPGKTGLYVQGLGSTERTFLMPVQGRGAIVEAQARVEARAGAAGLFLFMRENTVLAQRLDLGSLRLEGEPVSVAEDVRSGGANGRNSFSVSEDGVMVYRPGSTGNDQLTWYTRDGKPAGTALKPGAHGSIELSPDDKKVVVTNLPLGAGGTDLWLLDLASGVFSRLTTGAGNEGDPVWSPDSRRVAFVSQGKGQEIHETVVGSGTETTILADGKANLLHDWSRDGKTLLYQAANDVFVLPLEGDKKPQPVFQTPFAKDQFRISPDGRWVTYQSAESGTPEVYVAAFPTFTDRRQISAGGGMMPLWRRDGRELFYLSFDRRFVSVAVKAGATLDTGPPRVLFQTNIALHGGFYYYAVGSDGQRFLVREQATSAIAVEPLHVILNWPAALGR